MKRTKRLPDVPPQFSIIFSSLSKSDLIEIIWAISTDNHTGPLEVAAGVLALTGVEITKPYARGMLAGVKMKKVKK